MSFSLLGLLINQQTTFFDFYQSTKIKINNNNVLGFASFIIDDRQYPKSFMLQKPRL